MTEKLLDRVALNFTDLTGAKTGCTTLGSNKFWIGEVIQNDNGTCDFRCRWGSTGTEGSTKGSKFGLSEAAARKTLASKVSSKKRKGYIELDTRSKDEEVAKAAAKGVDLTNGKAPAVVKPSRSFDKNVEDLLGIIYNSNSRMVRSGLSQTAGATEDNPIGNLSDVQLDRGGELLDEIEALLKGKIGDETSSNRQKEIPLAANGMPCQEVIDLTNTYMSNIPREIPRAHRGRQNLHRVVVSSYERLENERKFLQLLRDAHLSQATFQAAAQTMTGDKVSVWYDGLGCDIEFCPPSSQDYMWLTEVFGTAQSQKNSNWFRGSQCYLRIKRVWKFTRKGSSDRFRDYANRIGQKPGALGRIWGWHGTRNENLLGIGKSGLLMPENLPKGVYISGKAFGRGIYHAPAWNATKTSTVGKVRTDGTNGALKSMNYTSARGAYYGSGNTANRAYMFLQEIALGVPEIRTATCWDKHRPSRWPEHDWIYANAGGCSTLAHDEIVTFSEDAQVFRFLIEVEA